MRKPCRCNSSASLRVLLQVQRKGDSGSPRVVGPTNASRAWRIWGSAKGFRPPPLLRILPPSSAFPAPLFNSRIPAWIVLRDRPVACATSDTPPCGNACASVAAQSRRCRSSSTLRNAWYFLRIPPTSSFCPMREAYHTYLVCATYLCAVPKQESPTQSFLSWGEVHLPRGHADYTWQFSIPPWPDGQARMEHNTRRSHLALGYNRPTTED